MTDNTLRGKFTLGIPEYRIQRILEQCYKHFDELPTELRIEVAEVMNDKLRAEETTVKELDLSTRARNVLDRWDCKTVADVIAIGWRKILTCWACGEKTIIDIQNALNERGFKFPKEGARND